MKKIVFIFALFVSEFLFCQQSAFTIYKVKDMGYISIPDNLEVQSGLYKQLSEIIHLHMGTVKYETLENRIVFQQKGANIGSGTDTYARIILKTYSGRDGEYPRLNSNFKVSNAEITQLSNDFKTHGFNDLIKLITWYGIENVRLNEKYNGIKISYLRQAQNNPYVYVEIYQINNNDRLHEITLSYRQKDSAMWKPLYEKIKESITIIEH